MKDSVKFKKIEKRLEEEKNKMASLLPSYLANGFKKYAYSAGGAIYSLYHNEEPNDFDFFISNKKFAKSLFDYFDIFLEINKYGEKRIDSGKLLVGFYRKKKLLMTRNAITLGKYQIVLKDVGEPKDVVSQFDFKHNMFWYRDKEVKTLTNWDFLEDNHLRFNQERARDICGTIIRVRKFLNRGFNISNSEMSKMLLKLNEEGFNDEELKKLKNSVKLSEEEKLEYSNESDWY